MLQSWHRLQARFQDSGIQALRFFQQCRWRIWQVQGVDQHLHGLDSRASHHLTLQLIGKMMSATHQQLLAHLPVQWLGIVQQTIQV